MNIKYFHRKNKITRLLLLILPAALLAGCGAKEGEVQVDTAATTTRSNESVVLETVAGGTDVIGSEDFTVDLSNASEGYVMVDYEGINDEVRLQVVGGNGVTYTYVIKNGIAAYPLSAGSGTYKFTGYEAVMPEQYATAFQDSESITIENEQGPFLYPNAYVSFNKNSECVSLAKSLAEGCTCDLEVIAAVYNYVTENITYDHDKAETVEKGYVPDPDSTLKSQKGICLDYASLMVAMLRSQNIPSRMEVGYAGDAYHAWLSSYIEDVGWISGVIKFDGTNWTLMDPTFAANSSDKKLKDLIGDGSYYNTKYIY